MAMAMTVAAALTPPTTSDRWSMASLRSALPPLKSASLRFHLRTTKSRSIARSHVALAPANPLTSLGFSDLTSYGSNAAPGYIGLRITCMRHGRKVPKLNRPPDQRRALIRGLTTQLLKHGRILTTKPRARAIRKYADKMITLAKDGSLHKRRQALGFIYEKYLVHALFAEVPDRFGERNGGYTRIVDSLPRRGDNAPMAYIELVD